MTEQEEKRQRERERDQERASGRRWQLGEGELLQGEGERRGVFWECPEGAP